jgi:nucleotide-binding universal stress UspA family protein
VPPEAREWCSVREVVRPGRAHNEILDMAGTFRADLIVMGTHGHGPLGRIFLGSTSQSVVRGAACPVVTVREVRSRPAAGARGSRSELQDLQPGR